MILDSTLISKYTQRQMDSLGKTTFLRLEGYWIRHLISHVSQNIGVLSNDWILLRNFLLLSSTSSEREI